MMVEMPDWSMIEGRCRSRCITERPLCASTPDAGTMETGIDGGSYQLCTLYHHNSKGLYFLRTVVFAADLKPGMHRLRLRFSANKDERGTGHAMRVLHFEAN
jgi:hypothetical protein